MLGYLSGKKLFMGGNNEQFFLKFAKTITSKLKEIFLDFQELE